MRRFTKLENEVAGHRQAADQNPDFRSEPDQRSACHRRQDAENDPADRFRAAEKRPAVEKPDIAVERIGKPVAEDLLGHDRRTVGQNQQGQELEDDYRMHYSAPVD